jgi:hypothetical protein
MKRDREMGYICFSKELKQVFIAQVLEGGMISSERLALSFI